MQTLIVLDVLVIFNVLTFSAPILSCPFPWVSRPGSKSCYYYGISILRSWTEARDHCMSMEGDLVRVHDSEEQRWLLSALKTLDDSLIGVQEWWTGLKRNPSDRNTWVWADNSVANTTFLQWGQGEPNNYRNNEHCAEIWDRTFNDKTCSMPLNYVCERSKDIPAKCQSVLYWQFHHGKCYKVYTTQVFKAQAVEICRQENSELVGITDADSEMAITELAKNKKMHVWLSMSYMSRSMRWISVDNSNTETVNSLFFWQDNEPTLYDGIDSCAALNNSATPKRNWYADNCTETKPFICQKSAGTCPPGFNKYGKRCYLFKASRRMSWAEARQYCENIASSLLDINSAAENVFVINTVKVLRRRSLERLWIGLTPNRDLNQGNKWRWVTKGGYFPATYVNVDPRQSGRSSCVYMDAGGSGKWYNDIACNESLSFVCYTYNNMAEEERAVLPYNPRVTTVQPITTERITRRTMTTPRKVRTTTLPQSKPMSTRTRKTTRTLPKTLAPSSKKPPVVKTTTKMTPPIPPITTTEKVIIDPLCGPYWEKNPNSPYCYAVSNMQVTWEDGRQLCINLGGDLLSVNTIEEQHYLTGKLKGDSKMWMGGSSRGEDGGWEWSDSSPFAYLNFLAGEPNNLNGSDRCTAMSLHTARWTDEYCTIRLGVLCKKRAYPPIPDVPLTSPPFVTGDKVYGCPPGWVEYRLSCFLIVRNKTSWLNALTTCRKEGADLTSIKDEGENSFILSQLPKSHCYNVYHTDDKCDKWAKKGECDKNPVWMAKNCQRACGACIRDCKNTYYEGTHCDLWARLGECHKNHKWMLKNCAYSCGVCDTAIYGGFWIGLTDSQQYMTFRWTDHSPVKYTTWARNEPNNLGRKGEDCVIMRLKDGRWNDYNCDEVMPGFVCKTHKKIIPKATVSPLSIGCVNDSLGYNAYCYSFKEEADSWEDALEGCRANGGSLSTINDRYVQAFIASQLVSKKQNYWIGLKQDYSSGAFEQWTSGQSVKFTHWSDRHTGGMDEDGLCVSLSTNHPIGLWDTMNCSLTRPSVCEYPREGYSTTTMSTTPSPTTVKPKCTASWTEFGNYCYKKFGDKQTWSAASSRCQQYGAELTSVHSMDEQQFLLKSYFGDFYRNSEVWIGLSDRSSENGFSWSDGTPFDFTIWGPNEPNDGGLYANEDCVGIYDDEWFDDNCNMAKSFICRVEKGAPVLPERNVSLPVPESCSGDDDWLYLPAAGKDICYYFSNYDVARTWYDTRDFCNSLGGDLVSITSQEILDFIISQTSEDQVAGAFWIGLNDIKHRGFEWSDDSFVNFLNWDHAGRFSSDTGKCVYQWPKSGRWFVSNCNDKLSRVVCQRINGSTDALTVPTPVLAVGGCPQGYTGSPVSNRCFKVLNGPFTQSEATTQCQLVGNGGFLATISSSLENDFITSLAGNVTGTGLWIGLYKSNDVFGWLDNGRFQYENWFPGEPSGYESCVELFVNRNGIGFWNDVSCWKSRGAVCQAPKNPVFPTPPVLDGRCPVGFTFHQNSCYKLNLTPLVRNTAAASCASESASLSSVNNEYEQAFLNVFMRDIEGPYWIGLQKKGPTFEWDNGWTYEYTKWDDNEPSDRPTDSCVVIDSGKWKDIACNVQLPSICQYSLAAPPTTPPPGTCPENTSKYKGSCYLVELSQSKSWVDSDIACKDIGMELASVHSQAEIQFIQNLARQISGLQDSPKLWIGLSKRLDASAFEWTDGSPLDFLFWEEGEPSDVWEEEDEDCVEMYHNGKWNDVSCQDYNKNYVCKMPQVPYQTTSNISEAENTTNSSTYVSKLPSENNDNKMESTIVPGNQNPPYLLPRTGSKLNPDQSKSGSLTAGQIIGILIGILLICVIVGAGFYVFRRFQRSATYSTDRQGFSNALYHKSVDNVSYADDNGSISSQSKIVKGGTH